MLDTSHHVLTVHPVNKMKIEFKCLQLIFVVHQNEILPHYGYSMLQNHDHHMHVIVVHAYICSKSSAIPGTVWVHKLVWTVWYCGKPVRWARKLEACCLFSICRERHWVLATRTSDLEQQNTSFSAGGSTSTTACWKSPYIVRVHPFKFIIPTHAHEVRI